MLFILTFTFPYADLVHIGTALFILVCFLSTKQLFKKENIEKPLNKFNQFLLFTMKKISEVLRRSSITHSNQTNGRTPWCDPLSYRLRENVQLGSFIKKIALVFLYLPFYETTLYPLSSERRLNIHQTSEICS